MMKTSRERFWQQVAVEFDKLNVALLQDDAASMEMGERAYLAFQKKLLRQVATERENQHLRRLVAHSILRFAYSMARTWTEYQRALRRVQRLGYLNVDYQSRAASFTLSWIADNAPPQAPLGWEMVEESERRLLRMRRKNRVRKQALAAIASVKQRATQKGLTPPKPPNTSKERSRRRGSP
jgi:hypothetical protein